MSAKIFFIQERGRAIAMTLDQSGTIPGTVTVVGSGSSVGDKIGELAMQSVIITSVSYDQKANHQFTKSLGRAIYLYTFGDEMGDVVVSGIGFSSLVDEKCTPLTNGTGVDAMLSFYKKYKVSSLVSNTIPTITVTIGKEVITGYLVSCRVSLGEPVEHLMSQFALVIKTKPDVGTNTPI